MLRMVHFNGAVLGKRETLGGRFMCFDLRHFLVRFSATMFFVIAEGKVAVRPTALISCRLICTCKG